MKIIWWCVSKKFWEENIDWRWTANDEYWKLKYNNWDRSSTYTDFQQLERDQKKIILEEGMGIKWQRGQPTRK